MIMVDIFDVKIRSRVMASIKSRKTKPELKLKKAISGLGFSYQPKRLLGNPDFSNKKHKAVIFVNGCFWHGCHKHYKLPASNVKYWKRKIEGNKKRDKNNTIKLRKAGYKVIIIWEHEINNDINKCINKIRWQPNDKLAPGVIEHKRIRKQ